MPIEFAISALVTLFVVGDPIGDFVLDLAVLESEGLIDLSPAFEVFAQGSLNAFMALGPKMWSRTRASISPRQSS